MVPGIDPRLRERRVIDELDLSEPGQDRCGSLLRDAATPQRSGKLRLGPRRCRQQPQADLTGDRLRICLSAAAGAMPAWRTCSSAGIEPGGTRAVGACAGMCAGPGVCDLTRFRRTAGRVFDRPFALRLVRRPGIGVLLAAQVRH